MAIQSFIYFNSKVVRLKGNQRTGLAQRQFYFNSKVVRLKVPTIGESVHIVSKFQFQSGAVKSHTADFLDDVITSYFNSKVVRLKEKKSDFSLRLSVISIPKWCG